MAGVKWQPIPIHVKSVKEDEVNAVYNYIFFSTTIEDFCLKTARACS